MEAEYRRQEVLRAEQRQAEADAAVKKADALAADVSAAWLPMPCMELLRLWPGSLGFQNQLGQSAG